MKRVLQDGAGDPRVLVIQRNKRIPGGQSHLQGNGRVADLGLSERILPLENAFFKAREPFEPSAAVSLSLQSLVINLQNRERSLHKFGDGRGSLNMKNGKSSLGRCEALRQRACCWTIPDGEILQAAIAVKTDATSPDPSQWHRDLSCLVAAESSLRTTSEKFFRRERRPFRLRPSRSVRYG
jgi:hypothetical protein